MKILVIDERNHINRKAASALFCDKGAELVFTDSFNEAERMMDEVPRTLDLVVDLEMPASLPPWNIGILVAILSCRTST